MRAHMLTHTHMHTSNSGAHSTQCSLHPKTEHTLGLSLPLAELPKAPHLHDRKPELHRHTQAASRRHWHSKSTITATCHGLPRGHPLPQPCTRWCGCTHESQSHTQTLTPTRSKQSWSRIWIPAHTQNTDTTAPPETQTPSAPHTFILGRGKYRYTLRIVTGTLGCLACAWGKGE